MRLSASILAGALALTAESSVRFTNPAWRPDLGISSPVLASATAEPLEMPKAQSFIVTVTDGSRRLEDRFDTFDLWVAQTVKGRWRDASGNMFYIARLANRPPQDPSGTVRTRTEHFAQQARTPFSPDDPSHRDEAAFAASPADLDRPIRPRRAQRKNMLSIFAYPSTNDHVFAAAFRPRSPERKETTDWYLAVLVAAPGEALDEAFRRFDEDFLDNVSIPAKRARPTTGRTGPPPSRPSEAELFRAAVRDSVSVYDNWHFASAEDVVVVDDLDDASRGTFIPSLTNSLPRLRRAYAACAPTTLSATTNQLAVVRVFATREEYLAHVGVDHKWTAALWDTLHRELVLYLPPDGTQGLLQTVWHEAFHQYLAYAAALVTAAPWFNEGNAELFEHSHLDRKGEVVFDLDPAAAAYVHECAADIAAILPTFMRMGYEAFYDGTQDEIATRYRIAWSLAYFLEVGAPKVRFKPFADLRADYVKALIDTRSMDEADRTVFTDEFRAKFITAWLDFWKRQ